MNFAEAIKETLTEKTTENGAFAYNTTGTAMLDFFGLIGASRPLSESEIEDKLAKAWEENAMLALRCIFYAGAIRGGIGLGERRAFRICLRWLGNNHPDIASLNLHNIAHFTRWDNIFSLYGTLCESVVNVYLRLQLEEDLKAMAENKPVSLMAKWLPSINTTSHETKRLARLLQKAWGMTEKEYRKTLSSLRSYLKIVEKKMSLGEWGEIDYPAVPSYAMLRYNKAFGRHDGERFSDFINSKEKINSSVLFPYDLVAKYMSGYGVARNPDPVIEKQWDALPNYLEKSENNVLVMADISGSMSGCPIQTSIGLACYFAQHNHGSYKNLFMTFASKPNFVEVPSKGLHRAISAVFGSDAGYSTNLMAAMDKVLEAALWSGVSDGELPEALMVISDMEIDRYFCPGARFDFWDTVNSKFHAAGYKKVPKLILWNVSARQPTFLTKREDVILVSGQSTGIFKNVLDALNGLTAYDVMINSLMREEFNKILLPENLN